MKTLFLSSGVLENSLLHTGDAIVAFANWKPRRGENVFHYKGADIHITAANGSIYMMSKVETKMAKIAFTPVPMGAIAKLAHAMSGAA